MASSSNNRSSNKEVLEAGTHYPDGLNDQEVSRPENSESSEKSSATKKRIKRRKICQESRKRVKARNDKIATDRNEFKEELIRVRALLEQKEKEADIWRAFASKMHVEQREDNRQQLLGTTVERGSTSASTEVEQTNEPFQSLPADSRTTHLAYDRLKDCYAASEARHAQEIAILVERHAQEVATIKTDHQQELEEARAREQNLIRQVQNLNFDPFHNLSNDN